MPDFNRHIRLITFDLDETLWPCGPVIQQAEEMLYRWLCRETPRVTQDHTVQSLREQRLSLAQQHPDIAHDLTALRLRSLTSLFTRHGYNPALAEQAMAVFLAARNQVTPFADVLPVLEALQSHYVLIALTNGNTDIRQTPLAHCFKATVSAAQAGAAKPNPVMFQQAMRLADVPPSQSLHVGDDPHLDVVPARNIGMQTLWINRNHQVWPESLPPPKSQATDLYALVSQLRTPI